MGYQVIARKWRPQAFEDVIGQEHITQTLRNAIEHDRLHHAYLFSGARGVGKTTTARLLAKALNCHRTDQPNISPCRSTDPEACPSCVEISESRSMDVLEIDAASHTGIDDVRDTIIENITVTPARDRYKAFIIDEVHQLSKPAFNALLKTIEEPPPNVVFVMATTELHKVPQTITSRCQEFVFRTIPQKKIYERLKLIADAEKIDISEAALRELARSGEGSMRDAQSNFDQVISFSGARIEVEDVTGGLGMASRDVLIRAIKAIADADPAAQLNVVDEIVSQGHDLRNFSRDLLSVLRDLMVYKIAGSDENLLDTAMLEPEQMAELSAAFSERDLLRFFHSIAETETKLKEAAQQRYVLEAGLIKLVEMQKLASIESVLDRLSALENALRSGVSDTIAETPMAKKAAVDASGPSEKKTLIPGSRSIPGQREPVSETEITNVYIEPRTHLLTDEPLDVFFDEFPREPNFESDSEASTNAWDDLSFIEALPERALEFSAERFEHFDHSRLDEAFEQQLLIVGDNLMRLPYAADLAASFVEKKVVGASAGASSSAATTNSTAYLPPIVEEESLPIPELGDEPTAEELLAYANSHPDLRRIARILRAKVVEVQKL